MMPQVPDGCLHQAVWADGLLDSEAQSSSNLPALPKGGFNPCHRDSNEQIAESEPRSTSSGFRFLTMVCRFAAPWRATPIALYAVLGIEGCLVSGTCVVLG